jgi:hypothetical protein
VLIHGEEVEEVEEDLDIKIVLLLSQAILILLLLAPEVHLVHPALLEVTLTLLIPQLSKVEVEWLKVQEELTQEMVEEMVVPVGHLGQIQVEELVDILEMEELEVLLVPEEVEEEVIIILLLMVQVLVEVSVF